MNKKTGLIAFAFLVIFAVGTVFADTGAQIASTADHMASWAQSMRRQALQRTRKADAAQVLELANSVKEEFDKIAKRFNYFVSDGGTMTQSEIDKTKKGLREMDSCYTDISNHYSKLLRQ
ncbi:hypothetical protein ACYULU_00905 [Breznakiellaceae bacterium SP9]